MAQNITLLGASYSAVPAVLLPKTGGGTARFDDASITTAVASDVAQGKQFLLADGSIGTGTASGGGGASNVVTGTFKGTTTGEAMDINIPYTGTGYPIFVAIFPKGGLGGNSTFNTLVQRYAMAVFLSIKNDTGDTPTYRTTGNVNSATILYYYKSSASNAGNYSDGSQYNYNVYSGAAATGSSTTSMKLKDNKTMSVFIAGTSYGFAANIEYTYYVIYSS